MKYISKYNVWIKEDLKFHLTKLQLYSSGFTSIDKKKRIRNKEFYNRIFKDSYSFRDKYDYSIPNGKYYKPVGIIATELVAKEDIQQLKFGIKKLIMNHTSHKFMGMSHSLDNIIDGLDRLDDTFSSWHTAIDCGRFDFNKISKLNKIIEYFDIKLRNFNSSYVAVEVHIYFSKDNEEKITDFINSDYKNRRGYISDTLIHNSKGSGTKKSKTVSHYNDAHLKSEILNNYLMHTKWELFKKLSTLMPFVMFKKGIVPPSVNIFNTNILPSEKGMDTFFSSVGISKYNGQFINEKEKLFFTTDISAKNNQRNAKTDMILLVNEERYIETGAYYSFNFFTLSYFEEVYEDIYKCYLANILFDEFAYDCVKYKLLSNKIKVKVKNLKRVLKLRNDFEIDMTWYKRFVNETDWSKEIDNVKRIFDERKVRFGADYSFFTNLALVGHNKLENAISEIEKDIDQKIVVIKHIDEYEREKKSFTINIIMLFISCFTLYLIINPQKAASINKDLIKCSELFKTIIKDFMLIKL